jgi:hypothetical protein
MNALWSVLVLLIMVGLVSLLPLAELVNNDPGFGSLAGGVAVAVAILLHALTNLVVCERNPARSASKQGSEKENA